MCCFVLDAHERLLHRPKVPGEARDNNHHREDTRIDATQVKVDTFVVPISRSRAIVTGVRDPRAGTVIKVNEIDVNISLEKNVDKNKMEMGENGAFQKKVWTPAKKER